MVNLPDMPLHILVNLLHQTLENNKQTLKEVKEIGMEKERRLVAVEGGMPVWTRAATPEVFEKMQRLFELLPDGDKEALDTLEKIVQQLEAPKRETASKIATTLIKEDNMRKFLIEALTALPTKTLKELEVRANQLKMKREPGGDCLIIEGGEKSHRIHL